VNDFDGHVGQSLKVIFDSPYVDHFLLTRDTAYLHNARAHQKTR